MTKERIVKQTIEISEMYYEMATKSFENAKLLLKKDQMSFKEFEEIIENYYQPILTFSSKILVDRNTMIINELEKYIDEIQNLTNNLSLASKKLQKSEEIFCRYFFFTCFCSFRINIYLCSIKNELFSQHNHD